MQSVHIDTQKYFFSNRILRCLECIA